MKDTTAIIKALRRKGYDVSQGKNGHWNVRKDGHYLLQFLGIMGFIYSLGPLVSWYINREERKDNGR
jgi:hypothetical protein